MHELIQEMDSIERKQAEQGQRLKGMAELMERLFTPVENQQNPEEQFEK